MKSTGVVRQLDNLGRVVLPIELRRTMDISVKDPLEVFVEGDSIILRKFQESCVFCGGTDSLLSFREKLLCPACAKAIGQLI